MSVRAGFIKAFLTWGLLLLCLQPQAQAQAADQGSISEAAIHDFFDEFQNMNTTLEEGRAELDIWLNYLDLTLTDDFVHTTYSSGLCDTKKGIIGDITKAELIKTYKDIGIHNYDHFEVSLKQIDIGDGGRTAKVEYTLDIRDHSSQRPLIVSSKASADLLFDDRVGGIRMQKQTHEQTVLFDDTNAACLQEVPEQE